MDASGTWVVNTGTRNHGGGGRGVCGALSSGKGGGSDPKTPRTWPCSRYPRLALRMDISEKGYQNRAKGREERGEGRDSRFEVGPGWKRTEMEKTSARGTSVRLHLRPAEGDLSSGWEVIQTSLRARCPLALAERERKARDTIPRGCSGHRSKQQAWHTDTRSPLWTHIWAFDPLPGREEVGMPGALEPRPSLGRLLPLHT